MLGLMQNRPLLISNLVDYAATWHGGNRDRLSRSGRRHASVQLRTSRGAREAGRQRARRTRRRPWRPRRDARLEQLSASRTLLRRHQLRPRAAYGQSAAVSRATPVHHPSRRGRLHFLRSRSSRRWSSSSHRTCRWCAAGSRFVRPKRTCRPSRSTTCSATRTLLATASPDYDWPRFDENTACTLCYTSGTTGNPKGVLYSHRSTILHAFAACAADGLALSAARLRSSWSCRCFTPTRGACRSRRRCAAPSSCFPDRRLDPESIYMLLEQEGCTKAGGIPTIWLNFLAWIENNRVTARFVAAEAQAKSSPAAPRRRARRSRNSMTCSASSCCTPGA